MAGRGAGDPVMLSHAGCGALLPLSPNCKGRPAL
jgi:hypothetical protein